MSALTKGVDTSRGMALQDMPVLIVLVSVLNKISSIKLSHYHIV